MIWVTGGNYVALALFALYSLLCFLFEDCYPYGASQPQLYPFEQRGKVEGNQAVRNDWVMLPSTIELILFLCTTTKPQVQNSLSCHCYPIIHWPIYSNICFIPMCFGYPSPTAPSIMPSPLQGLLKGLLHEWRKDALSPLDYKNLWGFGQSLFFVFYKLI